MDDIDHPITTTTASISATSASTASTTAIAALASVAFNSRFQMNAMYRVNYFTLKATPATLHIKQ